MRDFAPEKARKWLFLRNVCVEAFEKYGFGPLQTPMVEYFKVLTRKGAGGTAIKEEIYYFKDKGGRELGLRFDLTVPLARFVAKNQQLPKPFKRYSIDRVYRYDRPGENRYREFMQADIDTVGSASAFADFEMIAVTVEIMQRIGLDFTVRVNNQKLLKAIALACGVEEEKSKACFRCLDKLDKIGEKGVREELGKEGVSAKVLNPLKKNDLKAVEKLLEDKAGLEELNALLALLKKEKLDKFVKVDLCLARGLDYYTGNVFEVVAEGSSSSVAGGGRYDRLIGLFGAPETPAVGISFGIDRILDLLGEKIKPVGGTKIFVLAIGKEMQLLALELAQKIRALGIDTAMDLNSRSISKNLDYANKLGIPFAAILGEKELKKKEFTLKEMDSGKERKVKVAELKKLQKFLE